MNARTLLAAFTAAVLTLLLTSALHAQVPQIINYQGRVAVGTPAVNFDGSGAFKFALVNADGTTTYWSNDGTSTAGSQPTAAVTLTVTKGLYSVLLGDTALANMTAIPNSVFANADVRLRVWFDDGTNGSQLLTPDQRLAAVGYAMIAGGLTIPPTSSATEGVITQNGSQLLHTFGPDNFFAGFNAGNFTLTGSVNTAVGAYSLANNTTGTANTAIGREVLVQNATGNANTASGFGALYQNTAGSNNTALGRYALFGSTGTSNLALGYYAGANLATGDNNIYLGNAGVASESGIIRIGTPGTQTDTYLTGIIHGDGSGLTGVPVTIATPPPGMVLIPAGAFTMGNSVAADTDITNAAPVSTTVSAFYMDVNEVTLSQWQSVYYWAKDNGYTDLPAGSGKGPNHPVHTVNWYAVVKWCNARSEQAGKTPVYYTNDAQTTIYKTGNVDVTNAQVKWTVNGYRLPTEAEWEKAARGGRTGQRFPWGNTITQNLANYSGATATYAYDLGPNGYNAIGSVGGTLPATSPVGSFALNGYGLNDMAGNVFEWCWDWNGTPYAGGTDPRGVTTGSYHVLRGGGWYDNAFGARCAYRFNGYPSDAISRVGFRAVLPPGQP